MERNIHPLGGPWLTKILDGKTPLDLPDHQPGVAVNIYRNIQNEYNNALFLRWDLNKSMHNQLDARLTEILTTMRKDDWEVLGAQANLKKLIWTGKPNSALRFVVKNGFEYNAWLSSRSERLAARMVSTPLPPFLDGMAAAAAAVSAASTIPFSAPSIASASPPAHPSASRPAKMMKLNEPSGPRTPELDPAPSTTPGRLLKRKSSDAVTTETLLADLDAHDPPVHRVRTPHPRRDLTVYPDDDPFFGTHASYIPVDSGTTPDVAAAGTVIKVPRHQYAKFVAPLGGVLVPRAGKLASRVSPRPPLLRADSPTPEMVTPPTSLIWDGPDVPDPLRIEDMLSDSQLSDQVTQSQEAAMVKLMQDEHDAGEQDYCALHADLELAVTPEVCMPTQILPDTGLPNELGSVMRRSPLLTGPSWPIVRQTRAAARMAHVKRLRKPGKYVLDC